MSSTSVRAISIIVRRSFRPLTQSLSQLQLRNVTFCILLPIVGAFWSLYQTIRWQTVVLAALFYISTGVGITAGKLPYEFNVQI